MTCVMPSFLIFNSKFLIEHRCIAQSVEWRSPKPLAEVRILLRLQK
jgi:hypothetical protein